MVILIGGGALVDMSTVNEDIVNRLGHIRQTDGRKPIILFLPQASSESKPYVNTFYKEFGSRLKCKATCALWRLEEMDRAHIAEKFEKCDAIYIGGGNYDTLVKAFTSMDIEPLLTKAYLDGKLIVGNSAGAMILCKESISDYRMAVDSNADYEIVKGYGIVNAKLCPHSDETARIEYIRRNNLTAYTYLANGEMKVYDM